MCNFPLGEKKDVFFYGSLLKAIVAVLLSDWSGLSVFQEVTKCPLNSTFKFFWILGRFPVVGAWIGGLTSVVCCALVFEKEPVAFVVPYMLLSLLYLPLFVWWFTAFVASVWPFIWCTFPYLAGLAACVAVYMLGSKLAMGSDADHLALVAATFGIQGGFMVLAMVGFQGACWYQGFAGYSQASYLIFEMVNPSIWSATLKGQVAGSWQSWLWFYTIVH